MRWTRLQKLIYEIWDEKLRLQIHASAYPLSGSASVGRYWIALGKEIIWDVPRGFPEECAKGTYNTVASEITDVIKDYLNTPRNELLSRTFDSDRWGLIDLFRVADRRLGRKTLEEFSSSTLSAPARKVLQARLQLLEKQHKPL